MTKIAIVEDNKVIRESLIGFVQADSECRCVFACATAEEALEKVSSHQTTGAVFSVTLPIGDAVSFYRLQAELELT